MLVGVDGMFVGEGVTVGKTVGEGMTVGVILFRTSNVGAADGAVDDCGVAYISGT